MRRLFVSSILATGLAITGASGIASAEQPVDSGHNVHDADKTQQNLNSGNFSGEGLEYTVKPGDTLATIAEQHLGSADEWEVIARANGIESPEQLETGQKLIIPLGHDNTAATSSYESHQSEDGYAGKEEADNAMSDEDREVKGEITEINTDNESLTLTDENGNIHSLKLDNEELLEGIDVGDFVKVGIEGDGRVVSLEKLDKKA